MWPGDRHQQTHVTSLGTKQVRRIRMDLKVDCGRYPHHEKSTGTARETHLRQSVTWVESGESASVTP